MSNILLPKDIELVKCDMHLHSCYSKEFLITPNNAGMAFYAKLANYFERMARKDDNDPRKTPDYSVYFRPKVSPKELFDKAMEAGMTYFCLTDHDSIDGWVDLLNKYPELEPKVITGVEFTTYLPGKNFPIHILAYDISENQFKEAQKYQNNVNDLTAYLKQENILFADAHLFTSVWQMIDAKQKSDLTQTDLEHLINICPAVEARNGGCDEDKNKTTEKICEEYGKIMVAGSDTHIGRVGRTYTGVQKQDAETKEDFLQAIKDGKAIIGGAHGGLKQYTRDEIANHPRTYLGLWYSDGDKYIDKKVDLWEKGILKGIKYSAFETIISIFLQTYTDRIVKGVLDAKRKKLPKSTVGKILHFLLQ